MNLLEGRIDVEGDGAVLTLGQHRLDLPAAVLAALPSLRSYDGRDLVVGIRPEVLSDGASTGNGAGATLRAQVELREALGGELILHLRTAVRPAVTEDTMHVAADVDSAAIEALEKSASHGETLVVAKFDGRSRVRMGDTVDVAVDVERLHFFDPASGEALAR
jgi:multiple sugar transport system ATP-binding protein